MGVTRRVRKEWLQAKKHRTKYKSNHKNPISKRVRHHKKW